MTGFKSALEEKSTLRMGEIEEHGSHADSSMNNLVDSDAIKMQETRGGGVLTI